MRMELMNKERDKQITDTVSMDERREDCGHEERVRRK